MKEYLFGGLIFLNIHILVILRVLFCDEIKDPTDNKRNMNRIKYFFKKIFVPFVFIPFLLSVIFILFFETINNKTVLVVGTAFFCQFLINSKIEIRKKIKRR